MVEIVNESGFYHITKQNEKNLNLSFIILDEYFFKYVNDSNKMSLEIIKKFKLDKFEKDKYNRSVKTINYINLGEYFAVPFLIINKLLESIDGKECIIGRLKINPVLWNDIIKDDNSNASYKKLQIFSILTDEINLLVKTFNKDNSIDEYLLDDVCKLFIEAQNLLAKICCYVKNSNYYINNLNYKNENFFEMPNLLTKKFLTTFDINNNKEYSSIIRQFLKSSIKLGHILSYINDDNLKDHKVNDTNIRFLQYKNKKILITNFYINAIIKSFLYDLRKTMIRSLRL